MDTTILIFLTPAMSFLGSIIGSGLAVAVFNYLAESRKKALEERVKLKRSLATVYDQLHLQLIRQDTMQFKISSLCIELDTNKCFKEAKRLRTELAKFHTDVVDKKVDTTRLKQAVYDILNKQK
jgi:hypothetical protein